MLHCKASSINVMHRRNHSVGRVPPNFGHHGDQVYLVLSDYCNWWSFFCWALRETYTASQIANLRGEEKKSRGEWVKHGWNNNGRQGRGEHG